MSANHALRAQSPSESHPTPPEKSTEDHTANKSPQCAVMSVYQTQIAGMYRNVTVIWCKNLINYSLNLSVDNPGKENHYNCKIDLKPWHFWNKKGFKSFEVDGNRIDVFWDLRSAKFTTSPEPSTDYYVALVSDEEVALLLGDYKKEAFKRTKSRPSLIDAALFYKKENVFGKKCFTTRTTFDHGRRKEHDIVVENSISWPKEPEMWISIDGIVLIHVKNLQWKFRGNETVLVNKAPVQVFWDVHDWLFSSPGTTGHGLFIFKSGPAECLSENNHDNNCNGNGGGNSNSVYNSVENHLSAPEFNLFLYAWKVE